MAAHKFLSPPFCLTFPLTLFPLCPALPPTPSLHSPNAITVLGLLPAFACTVWAAYLAPGFLGQPVPSTLALMTGCAMFFYSTMDNMDGKQARRVGASSALGLLIDHGCDAVNAALISWLAVAVVAGAQAGTWQLLVWWLVPNVPFLFATWEEFHTGRFVLPIVNGPNEGLLTVITALFATAAWGRDWVWGFDALGPSAPVALRSIAWFIAPVIDAAAAVGPLASRGAPPIVSSFAVWVKNLPTGPLPILAPYMPLVDFFPAVVFVVALVTVVGNIISVSMALWNGTARGKGGATTAAALALTIIILLLGAATWTAHAATAHVVARAPLIFFGAAGALAVELNTRMLLASAAGADAGIVLDNSLPGRICVFAALPLCLARIARFIGVPLDDVSSVALLLMLAGAAAPSILLFFSVFSEVADVLGLDVFQLPSSLMKKTGLAKGKGGGKATTVVTTQDGGSGASGAAAAPIAQRSASPAAAATASSSSSSSATTAKSNTGARRPASPAPSPARAGRAAGLGMLQQLAMDDKFGAGINTVEGGRRRR